MERTQDLDPVETGEWVDSLRAVLHHQGSARATYLLERLADEAGRTGIAQPSTLNTPYVNTISPEREERADWDRDIEHRIRSIIRWNAVAIVLQANKESSELGGHIARFQSAATLYDTGCRSTDLLDFSFLNFGARADLTAEPFFMSRDPCAPQLFLAGGLG